MEDFFQKADKQQSLKRWKDLREAFKEITKEGIRKSDNHKLFQKSSIKFQASGWKYLEYDEKEIYFKRPGKNSKWELKAEFKKNNPMQGEIFKVCNKTG